MRSYRPSGAISAGGFILLLLLAIIVGAIVGGILWAVDNYAHLYLVIAFPILAGGIAGGLLTLVVRGTKVRNPLMAGLMGILAGLIMYSVYHYAGYAVTFRGQLRDAFVQETKKTPTEADLDDLEKLVFQDHDIKETGFVGYIKWSADTGFTVTNSTTPTSTTSESDIEIQGNVAYGYYALEILIAALIAAALPFNAAREPFDENANTWYAKPTVFAVASTKSRKALMQALKDGNFQQAGSLLTKEQIKYPRIEIWARRSPNSSAEDVMLIVNHMQRRNRPNKIKSGMVSAADLESINRGITQGVAPNPVVSKA